MKRNYYDFVFLTKEALLNCLDEHVNENTKKVALSKEAKSLLDVDEFKGVKLVVDDVLNGVYVYVESQENNKKNGAGYKNNV